MAISGNLKVTPLKLKNASQQFQQSDSTVNSLTQNMMDIVNQLQPTWAGEAATGYYNKLKGLQGDMTKLHKMINEHVNDLVEMANVYERAEAANVQAASALKINEIV